MEEKSVVSETKNKLSKYKPFNKILITTFITLIVIFYNTWGDDLFSSENSELASAEDDMKAARKIYDNASNANARATARQELTKKTKIYTNMYSSLKKPKKVTLLNKTMNTVILILIVIL